MSRLRGKRVATKNIVRSDFVDFFATTIVRSLHEYYRPPLLSTPLSLLRSRTLLHLEILALRQQLAMVNQTPPKRLRFHWGQRLFWVWLYRLWPSCLQTLQVFKPDTLVRWHRKGFRLYWTWKSLLPDGRAPTDRARGARTYPDDVSRQRWLGCTTDPRRTSDARHPRLPSDSRKVHDPSS